MLDFLLETLANLNSGLHKLKERELTQIGEELTPSLLHLSNTDYTGVVDTIPFLCYTIKYKQLCDHYVTL